MPGYLNANDKGEKYELSHWIFECIDIGYYIGTCLAQESYILEDMDKFSFSEEI